jgi:hypothetical protein
MPFTFSLAAPGPFEPAPCVTQGGAPARSSAWPSVWVVIVFVALWAGLVVAGAPPEAAAAGLGGAAGIGLRVAARLSGRARGGSDA